MNKQTMLDMEEKLLNTEIEMLSQINSYKNVEKLSCTIKTNESLSTDSSFKLPLKVTGKMLGIGRFKEKYYTEEELQKAVARYQSKIIPIKLDHKINEAGATIGVVDRIFWMPVEKVIGYEGHINDENHARNVLDGAHKEVSASIDSVRGFNANLGVTGIDLEFPELSIVHKGAYPGNTILPII